MPENNETPDEGDSDESQTDAFEAGQAEKESYYPDTGYTLVLIDMLEPLGEALSFQSRQPRLSDISMPPATDLEDYVAYDQYGNPYDHDDLEAPSAPPESSRVDELIETIHTGAPKPTRLALLRLAQYSELDPTSVLGAVPALTTCLEASDPAVEAEALTVLSNIAEEHPGDLTPAADAIMQYLSPDTAPGVLKDTVRIVAAVAESNPGAVVEAVPKLAAILQESTLPAEASAYAEMLHAGSPAESSALLALERIADAYPDPIIPVVPQLLEYLDQRDDGQRVGALGILGRLLKDYPNVAEETIPTAIDLLDADNYKVRGNAAGLLAELTDEYPDRLTPVVPRAIELLADEKEKVRYNATSILAGVAKTHPDAVAPAVEPLIGALDAEFEFSRSNAAWALGYLEADAALGRLHELETNDTSEEVRNAASFAIDQIEDTG